MKRFICAILCLTLVACGGQSNVENEDSDIIISDEDSVLVDDATGVNQDFPDADSFDSELISHFLNVAGEYYNYAYCYEEDEVINLFNGDTEDNYGWMHKEISEEARYVQISNEECYTDITFRIIDKGVETYAFFSQMDKTDDVFQLLKLEGDTWMDVTNELPDLLPADFFSELSDSDTEMVNEFGRFYVYITEDKITYLFGDWALGRELNNAYDGTAEFNQEADLSYELKWDDDKFWNVQVEN